MFKNVMMYRMLSPWTVTAAQLEAALESARYVECTGSQEKAVGWVEPRGKANGALVEVVSWRFISIGMIISIDVENILVERSENYSG